MINNNTPKHPQILGIKPEIPDEMENQKGFSEASAMQVSPLSPFDFIKKL